MTQIILCRKLYEEIQHKLTENNDLSLITQQYTNIWPKTLLAIHVQKQQEIARKAIVAHSSPALQLSYYKKFQYLCENEYNEQCLFHISQQIKLPPCILARIILRCHYGILFPNSNESGIKLLVKKSMQDPNTIEDHKLRENVLWAIKNDALFCPQIDKLRHEIGNEYEQILFSKLAILNITYIGWTLLNLVEEKKMRGLGYAKTPDVLLAYPIVKGNIVNWIESKASFGDDFLHNKNLEQQYWSYHNRYGPGMVIYWFGYIEDLSTKWQGQGILIDCDLSSDIVQIESAYLE